MERVDDVKLEVYHMNKLSAEIRERFTSDMGFVVDYLNEGSFERRKDQKIIHMEALCEMMEALTEDTRFKELAEKMTERQREGKEITMCEYIDMLEARGEARGEKRLAQLIQILLERKKYQEIQAVSESQEKRHELYKLYGI